MYNPAMHDIPNRIADVLLEVEGTLRSHDRWDADQPAPSALNSAQPFCIDTLRFEQWLQWIFLPRMKSVLEDSKPLPARSRIHSYAESCLRKNDPPTSTLLRLIKRFDDLITLHARLIRIQAASACRHNSGAIAVTVGSE